MSWSREQVTLLIDELIKHPCLYATKTQAYSNKHLKAKALADIETCLKSIKPTVTVSEIKLKLNGLKSTFLNEHRKHQKSLRSGVDSDEVYHPNLWYYDKLLFLLDHHEPRKSIDSGNFVLYESESENVILNDDADVSNNSDEGNTEYIVTEDGTVLSCNEFEREPNDESSSSTNSTVYKTAVMPKRKRKHTLDNSDVIKEATSTLKIINSTLTGEKHARQSFNDDETALANFIIAKLKQITDENVRLDVEEEIVICLYNGIKKCR